MSSPKVAIVHEWLVDHSGSEKVLEQILNIFPNADLFSVVEFLPDDLKYFIKNKTVQTTFIQKLPFAKKKYRSYLPLMPLAIEQLDVSAYDIVISNSHAVAKGVVTHSNQLHFCYCHSPSRYAWDLYHQYLRESGLQRGVKGAFAKIFLHYFRLWDLSTINRIDAFVANSQYIADRIQKVYGRKATVIHPPVNIQDFTPYYEKEDFYLTASRFVPYKKVDLIVEAFSAMPDKKLVVIGDGPDAKKIKEKAGENIQIMGFQPFEVLKHHMQRAKAFVFAADEDFGIVPVEAQACGTPVIAYGRGGALETVVPGKTGLFFEEQNVASLVEAVNRYDDLHHTFAVTLVREHAESFSISVFKAKFLAFVEEFFHRKTERYAQYL
ncbi:MAG: glycosyltransferase family 4 protein [Bacteroidota bacterium]